jgi:superfamily I DNA/RNA helicase
LIETEACEPRKILLLTFTRTAAQDLVSKLANLGTPGAELVSAGTLHGFCFGVLKKAAVLAITGRQTRMLLEHEIRLMLRDLDGDFGDLDEREALLEAFQAGWARSRHDHPGLALDPADRTFEAQVVAWLRHHQAMLIGEVVPIAFEYLKNNPHAEERNAYEHIIVDEYQDLNTLEQTLVNLLVGDDASLCIAGDDDQSIYRFRYAHPEGVVLFVGDRETEAHIITHSRRCPLPILDLANTLMQSAPDRAKPPLECAQVVPGSVSVVQWYDLEEEINGLVAAIAADITQERREPGDFLVLVHRREVGYRLRRALSELGIEAHSFFHENALAKSSTAQASLALLQLLTDRNDRPSLRVWLGLGDQEGRAGAYRRLREAARASGLSEFQVLERVNRKEITLRVPALLKRFVTLQARLTELECLELADLVNTLFPEDNADLALIRDLAKEVLEVATSPADLLRELVQMITQPEVPQSPDYVRVMSLHKSKGLTSPVVIVATAVDGIIPTIKKKMSIEDQEAAYHEQRRLLYVAITRSSDEMVVSFPMYMLPAEALGLGVEGVQFRRRSGKLLAKVLPARYLRELGPTLPRVVRGRDWLAARGG